MRTKWFSMIIIAVIAFSCQKENPVREGNVDANQSMVKSGTAGSYDAWPDVFDPANVISLYFRMTPDDWNTVRFDATNEILKKAWFRADNEEEILVELRRKSSRALPSETDPWKIGMKVSINYVKGQLWRGLNKLSLENGSDVGPVAEGVAWNLHELASTEGFYGDGVHAGLAAWVKVFIKICEPDDETDTFLLPDPNPVVESEYTYLGVYINVEQRNTQYLKNRYDYVSGNFWMYEVDDINVYLTEVGTGHSPAYQALNFVPFQVVSGGKPKGSGTKLNDTDLKTQLETWIDMQAMLTEGAVDAFSTNPDALFSHGKNFKIIDFVAGKRLYIPWDLDAVFGRIDYPIYGTPGGKNKIAQTNYQSVILNHPYYRVQYNDIMIRLLDGPLNPATVGARLDQWKAAADQGMQDDPYEVYGKHMNFDAMKQWIEKRAPVVRQLVTNNNAPAPRQ
jgi:hypothetical protein